MFSRRILVFSILFNLCLHFSDAGGGKGDADYEYRLREEIFTNRKVDNHTRPTQHVNSSTNVGIDLIIFHIQELNERSEILTVNAWLGQMWEDLNLAWNPDDYGGFKFLPIRKDQIWIPDVYLLNSAQMSNLNPEGEVPAVIGEDGRVWWWPPVTLKSICPIDLQNFPFDEHICKLTFICWSYSGRQVNLTLFHERTDLTHWRFDEHNEWETVESFGNTSSEEYGQEYIYQEVNFFVHLRRRAPYYRLAIVVPTVVAIMMTLLSFWIPPSARDRVLVSGFNLLILTILVVHLFWVIPRSGSKVPGIVVCCGNATFFAGLAFLLSVAMSSLYHRCPNSPPPEWLKNLLSGWLGVVLCLTTPAGRRMSAGNAQLLSDDDHREDAATTCSDDDESKGIVSEWRFLVSAIDRLGFIFYCISLLVIFARAFA